MPYPPTLPPSNRANTTPSFDNHPADHNALVTALQAIIAELGSDPSGTAADLTARLATMTPVGTVCAYAGAAAPTNWLMCDGVPVSRATYPALHSVMQAAGYPYGAGDGSTTFNTPDLRTRVPVGKGTTAPFTALNAPGGNKDAAIISHDHAVNDHTPSGSVTVNNTSSNHRHGIPAGRYVLSQAAGGGASAGVQLAINQSPSSSQDAFDDGLHAHTATVTINPVTGLATGLANGGVAGADRNMPPYIVLNYIIKAI